MAYVYRHIRTDKNEPFYVGFGTDNKGKYSRAKCRFRKNSHWNNIVKITNYEIDILVDGLTLKQALEKEIEFIKLYGRRDLKEGTLVNKTNGGDGTNGHKMTYATKEKMRIRRTGSKASEETKIRISLNNKGKNKGKYWNDERKKKQADAIRGNKSRLGIKHTEETKNKMKEKRKGRKHLPETLYKISKKNKERSKKYTINGIERYSYEWIEIYGNIVTPKQFISRIHKKWDVLTALTKPPKIYNNDKKNEPNSL